LRVVELLSLLPSLPDALQGRVDGPDGPFCKTNLLPKSYTPLRGPCRVHSVKRCLHPPQKVPASSAEIPPPFVLISRLVIEAGPPFGLMMAAFKPSVEFVEGRAHNSFLSRALDVAIESGRKDKRKPRPEGPVEGKRTERRDLRIQKKMSGFLIFPGSHPFDAVY